MAASNYETCEAHVLASEGGYSNNPHDPGGPTNWGITIYDARLYWKHDATAEDVQTMPKSVAQDIYRRKYWDALNCDALPAGLDYTVFDYGVNSGIKRSGDALRHCMGLSVADWHVTGDVVTALAGRDIKLLIGEINDERMAFLRGLKTWPDFYKGWTARVASVRAVSQQMAVGSVPAAPVVAAAPSAKAVDDAPHLFSHLAAETWAALTKPWSKT